MFTTFLIQFALGKHWARSQAHNENIGVVRHFYAMASYPAFSACAACNRMQPSASSCVDCNFSTQLFLLCTASTRNVLTPSLVLCNGFTSLFLLLGYTGNVPYWLIRSPAAILQNKVLLCEPLLCLSMSCLLCRHHRQHLVYHCCNNTEETVQDRTSRMSRILLHTIMSMCANRFCQLWEQFPVSLILIPSCLKLRISWGYV